MIRIYKTDNVKKKKMSEIKTIYGKGYHLLLINGNSPYWKL